jgi:hypothetical protein
MKGINNNSAIVNPFAQTALTLTIDDQGQAKVDTQLPPEVVVKLLTQAVLGMIFSYVDQMALAAQQGKLKTTNLV